MTAPVLSIAGVSKHYSALRPLRIQSLQLAPGERVALSGLDASAAELLVNLVTGASLPDQGTIHTFGRATSEIVDGDAWLASLEKFGIVSARAVLLEGSTLQQNLALPFTLDIHSLTPDVTERIAALARECGIRDDDLRRQVGEVPAAVQMRMHLARAVALDPQLLLVEHPTSAVADDQRVALGRDFAAVAERRGVTALIMTLDPEFAEVAAHRSLALQPATGALVPWKQKRGWFR